MISVEDNGTGIRPKDQLKLFKLFGSLKNTRELNQNGIGIGLHLSNEMTAAFKGKTRLKSKFGIGSRFQSSMIVNCSKMPVSVQS